MRGKSDVEIRQGAGRGLGSRLQALRRDAGPTKAAAGQPRRTRTPLKIALCRRAAGRWTRWAQAATRGWEYAAAEANAKGGVDGHKVELVKATTDGSRPTTVRAVRKAVTQDGAKYVSGVDQLARARRAAAAACRP